MFIKQCHGASLVGFQLKSMIKSNGSYAVHGIYYPLPKGRQLADSEDEVLLPKLCDKPSREMTSGETAARSISAEKRSREGKGSHTLTVVRKCLIDSENWLAVEKKRDYHFPGVFSTKHMQQLY